MADSMGTIRMGMIGAGWIAQDHKSVLGSLAGAELVAVCDLDSEPRNPIVQTRSFGAEPANVGTQAAAWIAGCQEHGVLA